jgi:hypothetical protein
MGYGGSWKAQWKQFANRYKWLFIKNNIDASDYRVATDQRLTEANEVLETGLKLNVNYAINANFKVLNGYQLTGMLNQTTVRNLFEYY